MEQIARMLNSNSRKRVVIVGGGISGLAAAHQVQKSAPHMEVKLLESSSSLGGVIGTSNQNGFLIEDAADNFITTSSTAIDLCDELGLSNQLIRTNPAGRGAMVLCRGKLEPIPSGFMVMSPSRIWPMLTTRILSLRGKLRSGCEVLMPRRRSDDDESLQSFVSRRLGREMFDRMVQPLVGGIYTADPARLSVAATMPRFLEMERKYGSLIRGMMSERRKRKTPSETRGGARYSQFMALRKGMSQLIEALEAYLPEQAVQLNSRVRDLRCDDDGWTVDVDDGSQLESAAVIIAAPATQAATMLRHVSDVVADELGQIEYASCAVVSLAFAREQVHHPIDSFGFVVPIVEGRCILSCSFSSEKYEGRAPEGTLLMRVFIGGAMQPDLLHMSNAELLVLAQRELAQLLQIQGEPILKHIVRQRNAMPQYHVGHNARLQRIERHLRSHPTLGLAGNSFSGVGVPGCIESGQKAAQRILKALQPYSKGERPTAIA